MGKLEGTMSEARRIAALQPKTILPPFAFLRQAELVRSAISEVERLRSRRGRRLLPAQRAW
jgi:hypothetical protein